MSADSNILLLPLCFFGLYMILEAADWGLCLAAPLVSRNEEENHAILGLLKPGLDGNELWFFLGMFMMGAAIPSLSQQLAGTRTVMIVLVALGALLRLAACFGKKFLGKSWMMKLNAAFSVIVLAVLGLISSSLLMEGGSLISAIGIFTALWLILSAFQLGSLYGAVKVVNPLGERFRASFLVSSVLNVVVYIILAILLKNHAAESNLYGSFFWISLVATAILFALAFFFTRTRHVKVGLAAVYFSSFFAIAIYLSAYAVMLPAHFTVELDSLKNAMDGLLHLETDPQKRNVRMERSYLRRKLWENFIKRSIPLMKCLTAWGSKSFLIPNT